MAEQTQYEFAAIDTKDILADKQRGWNAFVRFATWSVGVTVVILLGLLVFVA